MDFWEAQRNARRQTTIYLLAFSLMTGIVAVGSEYAFRYAIPDYASTPAPLLGALFVLVTVGAAVINYLLVGQYGGGYVAESMGCKKINPSTSNPKEKQLLNIIEEMAIAAAVPLPAIYLIPSKGINAFAAGLEPQKAAVAVTQGALELLSRDELQGVVAHEMGHIANGDMRINMRLAALVMGFFVLIYLGLRVLQFSSFRSSGNSKDKKGNPVLIAALILIAAGAIAWFAGTLFRCSVSRQREYLADASSVQFTRHPDGLLGALKKIKEQQVNDMPASGQAYAHLYFDHSSLWGRMFATHPPLDKRIAAIQGKSKV